MTEPDLHMVLPVPLDIFKQLSGFSLDIGCSVSKVVYIDEDDWEKISKNKDRRTGDLRLVSFALDGVPELLSFLSKRCHIRRTREDPHPVVFTTGMGCRDVSPQIRDTLNVRPSNLSEFTCFSRAFAFFAKNIALKDFLYPLNTAIKEDILENTRNTKEHVLNMACDTHSRLNVTPQSVLDILDIDNEFAYSKGEEDLPISEQWPDLFQCLLVMCGSGFPFIKVQSDGSFEMVELIRKGGWHMLHFASLITGVKDYKELMELATEGDVSVTESSPGFNHVYSARQTWGNVPNRDTGEASRADLCRGVVSSVVRDVTHLAWSKALSIGVHHVFFTGSFINSTLTRDLITSYWVTLKMENTFLNQDGLETKLHFVKPGSHLGALGAILHHMKGYTPD